MTVTLLNFLCLVISCLGNSVSITGHCNKSIGGIPDGTSVNILEGTTKNFRCISYNRARFEWTVIIGNREFGSSAIGYFNISGVTWTTSSSNDSILTLDSRSESHFTGIRCIILYFDDQTLQQCSTFININIYGVPMPPTNITLDPLSSGAVNVSWQTNPTDVIFSFELIVTISSVSHVYGTNETFFTLQLNNTLVSSACEKYELRVRARNDGGFGQISEVVTAYLPWLPDVSVVESSLQHTVIKSESGVSVTITHQDATVCEDDNTAYTIHVGSGDIHPTSEIGDMITYTLNSSHGLEDDARYEYNISVANSNGEVYTQPRFIYTSDVQSVCGYLEGSEVTIVCMFAEGSPASGCKVSLVTNISNITIDIIRDSSSKPARRTITVSALLTNISRLYASDIESDGSISSLHLPGSLSTDLADCNYLQLLSGTDVSLLVITVIVPATSIILVVGIATIILIVYQKTGKRSSALDHKNIFATENPAYGVSGMTRPSKTLHWIDSDKEQTEPVYAVITDL